MMLAMDSMGGNQNHSKTFWQKPLETQMAFSPDDDQNPLSIIAETEMIQPKQPELKKKPSIDLIDITKTIKEQELGNQIRIIWTTDK
jgi:hypothetical protein